MARNYQRLPSASVAPLIHEAVQRLNPEKGLTQDELVSYVFSHLGFEEDNIRERVDEFLNAGTNNGALIRTDGDRYQLVEERRLRAALDTCCAPRRQKCKKRCCYPPPQKCGRGYRGSDRYPKRRYNYPTEPMYDDYSQGSEC